MPGARGDSLETRDRRDRGQSRAISAEVAEQILRVKRERPRRSIRRIIRMLERARIVLVRVIELPQVVVVVEAGQHLLGGPDVHPPFCVRWLWINHRHRSRDTVEVHVWPEAVDQHRLGQEPQALHREQHHGRQHRELAQCRLARTLESRGHAVRLTRDGDQSRALTDRTALANRLDFMNARGIIPRETHANGLPGCVRITIGREDEMRAVASAIAEFMG